MKKLKEKRVIFAVQPDLYEKFKKCCEKKYKTISETLRDLIVEYVERKTEENK